MPKNITDCYLYQKQGIDVNIMKTLMTAPTVNTDTDNFKEVVYEFNKRAPHPALYKVLLSKSVRLISGESLSGGFPRSITSIYAHDPKDKKNRIIMDVTPILRIKNVKDKYELSNNYAVDILVAQTTEAMLHLIYSAQPTALLSSYDIVEDCMRVFSSLFEYIINYLFKINVIKEKVMKCKYLACMYFVKNLMGKDFDKNYMGLAAKVTDITPIWQNMILANTEDIIFKDINTFIRGIGELLGLSSLTTEAFVDKWIYVFGIQTVYGMEYLPTLFYMIISASSGVNTMNINTIENVCGASLLKEAYMNLLNKGVSKL